VQAIIILLLVTGLIVLQALMGGIKLFFSIPGYCFVALCALAVLMVPLRRLKPTPRLLPISAAILLAAYVLIRTWTSPVEYLARSDRFMVLAALIVYLTTAFCLPTPKHRLSVIWTLLAVTAVQIVFGFIQFQRGDQFMLLSLLPDEFPIPQIFRPDYGWRASGFYGCPNYLAGLIEVMLMIAIALAILGRWRPFPRMVISYCAVMFLAGLAITGSRGGYLSAVAGLLVFLALLLWIMKKLRPRKFLLTLSSALILAGLAVGAAVLVMSENSFIRNRLSNLIETQNMRRFMWAASLEQFKISPVFGTGSGTYLYYGRQFRDPSVQNDPIHVHCDYLELLSEYGIVGAGFGAVFLIAHAASASAGIAGIVRRRLRPANRVFSNELAILIGSGAAIGTLISHSVVDFNGHIPANALLYAFLFGILANPSSDPEVAATERPRVAMAARFGIPALGVMLFALVAPRLQGEYHAEWARVHLRSSEFMDLASGIHRRISWGLGALPVGVPGPINLEEQDWALRYKRNELMDGVTSHARQGLDDEPANPNLYYYLGEAKHFLAMTDADANRRPLTESDKSRRRELLLEAVEAYAGGIKLYPNEFPILIKLGRALDNLGEFAAAEVALAKAIRIDPNQALPYAYFGYHLWVQGKLTRAEAYYRKALSFDARHSIALPGLLSVLRIRGLTGGALSDEDLEMFDRFDNEPLTPEDEARGVVAND
jgi:O-antigen ligase/tetratricopeptide (TPR) repeat protein